MDGRMDGCMHRWMDRENGMDCESSRWIHRCLETDLVATPGIEFDYCRYRGKTGHLGTRAHGWEKQVLKFPLEKGSRGLPSCVCSGQLREERS